MKALYTTGPGDYGLVERPNPVPRSDEALIQVAHAGLCHTDVIIRSGEAGHVCYPFVPGHEFSGVVEVCGSQVVGLEPGDRVAVHTILACGQCLPCHKGDTLACERYDELGSRRDGGFAEYCTVPARYLFRLPDQVGLPEGAMAEPLANAVSAVRQADLALGDRVVIIGPGPIGLLALQVARLAHPSVLVLVGTRDERLCLGERLGATHTVNARRDGALDTLRRILDGKGADAIIECAGTPSALRLAMDVVGYRARVVIEGVHDQGEEFGISPYRMLAQSCRLVGVAGWTTADFARAVELIALGLVDVKPLITHTLPLEEWETGFHLATERKDEAIKVHFAL